MVTMPNVVGTETEVVDGKTVVKQMYADGSYGVEYGNYGLEIFYPNGDVLGFLKDKNGEYYLAEETRKDGTVRRFKEHGLMYYEKLPNGEERKYDVFFSEAHIMKEVIPNEVTRHYKLSGKFSSRGRLIPGTEFNYLQKEEFANGDEIEYYRSRKGKIKKSEKVNGHKTNFYEDGVTVQSEEFPNGNVICYYDRKDAKVRMSEKLEDGVLRTYYEDGVTLKSEEFKNGDKIEYYNSETRKVKSSQIGEVYTTFYDNGKKETEKLPNGAKKEWDSDGRITHEVRADKTVVDYKYDENGNLIYHAVNGKEDTVKYLAMKKVAERQSQKSEKLREQHVEYTDSNGNVRERQSVEKLKPLQKTVQMLKAMREVKKSLKR